jgi:hypothetical protein
MRQLGCRACVFHYFITFEIRVLGPKPKLVGFHISGPATPPYTPKKEMSNGEGRERRFYYMAQDMPWEEAK